MAVSLTPEQQLVMAVRNGFRVICANAGTGKTFSLCELFLELYQKEEKRLFPNASGHVGGKEQLSILRQFLVVTFTVAAAQELNHRILTRFHELGIPEPEKNSRGNPYRVCRTLDSYLQSWFMKPRIFEAWMDSDPDAERSIRNSIESMPQSSRALLSVGNDLPEGYNFGRKWAWLTVDTVDTIIIDAIMRERLDLGEVPGITPMSQWPAEWESYMRSFAPPEDPDTRWGEDFWKDKVAAYKKYHAEMLDLNSKWKNGELANHPEAEKLVASLAIWEQVFSARRDFSSIYEIARAKGYHPVRGFDNLAKMSILNEIAASISIADFKAVHEISLRYYATKVRHHLMDHGDYLNTFVDILERNNHLIEPDREYPRMGIRTKYLIYDEAQDNSPYQNKIIYLLKPKHGVPTLCVVCGDAKQAIYGFRGACSYGFGNMLEKAMKKDRAHVVTLTCSFRSAISITDLGNVISTTLPRYAKNVFPSVTIFKDAGRIIMAPPLKQPEDEAAWVLGQINEIIERTKGSESIMVIQRNNFGEHPILPGLLELEAQYGEKVIRHLTIHRSKGLEADNVFVLGLTSTIMPDPRGNEAQEINLFYVACTRPRRVLYLSCPYQKKKIDPLGRTTWESVGPSPFIHRVQMLDDIADKAGWPMAMREDGDNAHRRAIAQFLDGVRKKTLRLRQQWKEMFPDIPLRVDPDDEPTDEVGGVAVPEEIRRLEKKSLYDVSGKLLDESIFKVNSHLKERLERRLRDGFMKNGDVPRLSREEFAIAIKQGWIVKSAEGGKLRFGREFRSTLPGG